MKNYYNPVEPVVETKYGKLRGYTYGDINHFLGVKYADAKRFCMPTEPASWTGIKEAKKYGPIMLQMRPFNPVDRSQGMNQPWAESEDCQYLNIWAPDDNEKHPVFVYMHGGGFFSGSSIEFDFFDGFNMAKKGNMVVVSLNHRLNFLGHMNLVEYGEEFHNTANLGIADLVSCLKWINQNIAAFGGDPENVTICGHSGGGGKVLCMYQIEEARKYFTRGICVSGTFAKGPHTTENDSRIFTKALLDELKITKENISEIYTVPYSEILAAYKRIAKDLVAQGIELGHTPLKNDYYAGFPMDDDFANYALDKPLLMTTALGEFNFKINLDYEFRQNASVSEKEEAIRKRFGERADKLMDLFRKAYPDHDIIDLLTLDSDFRIPAKATAIKKAKNSPSANTYLMVFAYNMPCNCSITPWHGAELPFIFMNTDKVPVCNEPVYGEKVAEAMQEMVINFAKNGNPNNSKMPEWLPVSEEHPYTMVVDKEIVLKDNYDKELMDLYDEICPPLVFHPES